MRHRRARRVNACWASPMPEVLVPSTMATRPAPWRSMAACTAGSTCRSRPAGGHCSGCECAAAEHRAAGRGSARAPAARPPARMATAPATRTGARPTAPRAARRAEPSAQITPISCSEARALFLSGLMSMTRCRCGTAPTWFHSDALPSGRHRHAPDSNITVAPRSSRRRAASSCSCQPRGSAARWLRRANIPAADRRRIARPLRARGISGLALLGELAAIPAEQQDALAEQHAGDAQLPWHPLPRRHRARACRRLHRQRRCGQAGIARPAGRLPCAGGATLPPRDSGARAGGNSGSASNPRARRWRRRPSAAAAARRPAAQVLHSSSSVFMRRRGSETKGFFSSQA